MLPYSLNWHWQKLEEGSDATLHKHFWFLQVPEAIAGGEAKQEALLLLEAGSHVLHEAALRECSS